MLHRALVPDFQQNYVVAYTRQLIISAERNGLNCGFLQVDFVMWSSPKVHGSVPSIDLDFFQELWLSVTFLV